jgi:hypothetical protein
MLENQRSLIDTLIKAGVIETNKHETLNNIIKIDR